MALRFYTAARLSLGFLWLFTGITSEFYAKEIGYEVLNGSGITGPLADFCILTGSVLDVVVGIWLLIGRSLKYCYFVQMVVMVAYTLMLTIIEPVFWLHPFGPLTKNVPLFIMVYYLFYRECLRLGDFRDSSGKPFRFLKD